MSDQFGGHAGPGYAGEQRGFGQSWGTPAASSPLQSFVERYPAAADVERPTPDFLAYAERQAPQLLVELWREHGIGFYGEQRLAVVDPGDWIEVLQTWLGDEVTSFPFAVTSFGHLYHYDRSGGRDRIQCLDPHFQTNTVVAGDLASFFGQHLLGSDSHVADLEGPRGGARSKLGPLNDGEIYFFDPILALGGQVSPDTLAKGDGRDHLKLIHQRVVAG